MGTITTRKRSDGTVAHTAQIRLKRGGKLVHTESKTFERKPMAVRWLALREAELAEPGALDPKPKADATTLGEVITRYVDSRQKEIGRTKAQVLRTVGTLPIARLVCSAITTQDWTAMAEGLDALPQTRQNYLSHIAAVAAVAKPLWGVPLDAEVLREASVALRRHGIIGKTAKRDRRPTVAEMDALMAHFADRRVRVPRSNPMPQIVAFALYSARRLDEILRIRWADLREDESRVLVRDMKNPGEKAGNDVWCDLPPEALRIVLAMPRTEDRIFPFGNDAVGMAFTRAVKVVEVDKHPITDLHFHDLRHEGASRLIEMGWQIPRVAAVTGHRSWASLHRYSHHRQVGDKWAGWPWLDRVAPLPSQVSKPDG